MRAYVPWVPVSQRERSDRREADGFLQGCKLIHEEGLALKELLSAVGQRLQRCLNMGRSPVGPEYTRRLQQ